jgi:uncharacterized protein
MHYSSRSRKSLCGWLLAALSGACANPAPQTPAQLEPTRFIRLEGDVRLPNGSALAYAAILTPDPAATGAYLGTIDIPRQALAGASLSQIRFQPREYVAFELAASGAPHWVGHYNADGSLECRFSQAEQSLPCTMREVTERAARAPTPYLARQTPLPPFPYRVSEVRIDNAAAHLVLAGTLTLPSGAERHPAVLLIGDREPLDRDASIGRHRPFLVLADRLTRAGVAVLRLDARGVGGSDGGPAAPSASDLASDVAAAVGFLRQRPELDVTRIGSIGRGYGALRAAQAAAPLQLRFVLALEPPPEAEPALAALTCPTLTVRGRDFPGLNVWFQHAEGPEYAEGDKSLRPRLYGASPA